MAFSFVYKQLFWWSASLTLDNYDEFLGMTFSHFLDYTLPHTLVGLAGCISTDFSVLNILTHLTTMQSFCFESPINRC